MKRENLPPGLGLLGISLGAGYSTLVPVEWSPLLGGCGFAESYSDFGLASRPNDVILCCDDALYKNLRRWIMDGELEAMLEKKEKLEKVGNILR